MTEQSGSHQVSDSTAGDQPSVDEAAVASPPDAVLIRAYFRRVAAQDQPRLASDITATVTRHRDTGGRRNPGDAVVSSYTPAAGEDGWGGSATIVDIVTDDMPYLVDTVVSELAAAGLTAHRVIHPILAVRRDADGTLLEVLGEAADHPIGDGVIAESWMHVLTDRTTDPDRVAAIVDGVRAALAITRTVVGDAAALRERATDVAGRARRGGSTEAADLLEWMISGNATVLGYRCHPAPDTMHMGLLRPEIDESIPEPSGTDLGIQQVWPRAAVGREQAGLVITVPETALDGLHYHQFLVTLTASGRTADITSIPVLRTVVAGVLSWLGASPNSYSGQRALEALASYPRAELFWADQNLVATVVAGQLQLASRRRVRTFLQPDPAGRFISVLVFLPRDRYTTERRLAIQDILAETLGGVASRYAIHVRDAALASLHFTVMTPTAGRADVDVDSLNRRLRQAVRDWSDDVAQTVVGGDDGLDTADAKSRYVDAFDGAYKEDYTVSDAIEDLKHLDSLAGPDDLGIAIVKPPAGAPGDSRLKLYVTQSQVSLSQVMPMLQSMGVTVIDERPYDVRRSDGVDAKIYDFGLVVSEAQRTSGDALVQTKRRFADAFAAAWHGWCEIDGFNALVLEAQLEWRQIAMVRAYAKYLRQIGSAYTQGYVEQVLVGHPTITANLAALFAARFDPDRAESDRAENCDHLIGLITAELDDVASLDADRILRTYLHFIQATVRTNFYQEKNQAAQIPHFAFKIDPHRVPGMPKPVPAHEIWVYSPKVEGVHLRFGAVARGGLRWSDRPEDFRTEVLGLVKAQEVKNAIIVPVGAKGGFVVKQPPTPTGNAAADRDATQAEGVASYVTFISCLLDVTDNRVGGAVIGPDRVVRHDEEDPYLVVAADKGTASFSDIANGVSEQYGFWLGDAFASGGSAGYDHKGMGITARGGWESVKHHFRELGIDTQTQDFTCVGIGDMSGDVFGNGLLRSEHTKLVAAFDHRDIFIDPDPDPAVGFAERQRLFDLPRSSWADYRTELISAGGGVWSRSAKSIPVSAQARAALGLDDSVTELPPVDLIRAILMAPVDLLWNGGIGTYIKASTETNASVGNKANDAVRINGADIRAKVVGEGGNLGATQLGRIEYARTGGRINTDAIDNSAGVDASDHEVNIKIALQPLVADGELALEDRNELLRSMTDSVADLVLADNTAQNRLLGVSRHHAGLMLSVHARQIDALVADGLLDRELEFLPSADEIAERLAAGTGLTSPELSVLVAYTKAKLAGEMLRSDLPTDPAYRHRVIDYFPGAMADRYPDALTGHPLAREIVTTMTANEVVNQAGITYAFRLGEEIAASATDAIRAFTVVSEVFALPQLVGQIDAADHVVPAACQDHMTLLIRRVLDRAARWFLSRRPQPLDVAAEIARYRPALAELGPRVPDLLQGAERDNVARDIATLREMGATEELARRVAYCLYTYSLLDITDVAESSGRSRTETAELYYALSAHLDFDALLTAVTNLERGDRWHALARQAVRDDLYSSLRMLTADVLSTTEAAAPATAKITQWEDENASRLLRARATLSEISRSGSGDLATLSVAAREVRSMIRG